MMMNHKRTLSQINKRRGDKKVCHVIGPRNSDAIPQNLQKIPWDQGQ